MMRISSILMCCFLLAIFIEAVYFLFITFSSRFANQKKKVDDKITTSDKAKLNYSTFNNYDEEDELDAAIDSLRQIVRAPFSNEFKSLQREGVRYFGSDKKRLEHILMKLFFQNEAQRPLRIAAVGGSSTSAHGISRSSGYLNLLCKWLSEALGEAYIDVECINSGLGATGSYFVLCIDEFLDLSEIDVLILEFALNDLHSADTRAAGYYPHPASPMEELVRKALRQNPKMHIIFVIFTPLRHMLVLDYPPKCPNGIDAYYYELAQHYELTAVHFRHFFCNSKKNISKISRREQKQLARKFVSKYDHSHANDRIHAAVAEFLVSIFRNAFTQVFRRLKVLGSSADVKKAIAHDSATFSNRLAMSETPFYPTTRTNIDSECFLSLRNENTKLRKAIVNASSGFRLWKDVALDRLLLFPLGKSVSFIEFNLTKLKEPSCQGKQGYVPRLAMAYQLCNCSNATVDVFLKFVTKNGLASVETSFPIQLFVTGFQTNYVHYLAPPSMIDKVKPMFCRSNPPVIDSLIFRIDRDNSSLHYPIRLNTVILEYQCC